MSYNSDFLTQKPKLFPTMSGFKEYNVLKLCPVQPATFGVNATVRFTLMTRDLNLILADSFLIVQGRVVKNRTPFQVVTPASGSNPGNTETIQPADEPKLNSNFGAHLFSSISLNLNNVEIENVRKPGVVSTLFNLVRSQKSDKSLLEMAGIQFDSEQAPDTIFKNDEFQILIPLRLILNFCYDRPQILRGVSVELTLQRAENDLELFYVIDSRAPEKNKVEISDMSFHIPHVKLHEKSEISQLSFLNSNQLISLDYRSIELLEYDLPAHSSSLCWPLGSRAVQHKPLFLILAFYKDKFSNFTKANFFPSNLGLNKALVYINSRSIPKTEFPFDTNTAHITQNYLEVLNFQLSYLAGPLTHFELLSPLYSKHRFSDSPIHVFSLLDVETPVFEQIYDLKLEFSSSTPFGERAKAICLLVYEKSLLFNPRTQSIVKK